MGPYNLRNSAVWDFLDPKVKSMWNIWNPEKEKEEIDYLERKRREAEGLETKITDQGFSTDPGFSFKQLPSKMLSGILGAFTLLPRGIATGVKAIKGDLPEYQNITGKNGEWAGLKDLVRLGSDVLGNQGPVQFMSYDTILRDYGPEFFKKNINWRFLDNFIANRLGIESGPLAMTSKEMSEALDRTFNKFYAGKKTGIAPIDAVVSKLKDFGMSDEKVGNVLASKSGYFIPGLGAIKVWDALNKMAWELGKDPAAVTSFIAEIPSDPFTWIGAPGAFRMLTAGAKSGLKGAAAKGLVKYGIKELAGEVAEASFKQGGRLIGKEATEGLGVRGLKLLGGNTDDLVRFVRTANRSELDTVLKLVDDIPGATLYGDDLLKETVDGIGKRYGRDFLKKPEFQYGITEQGMRELGVLKNSPEMQSLFGGQKYKDDLAKYVENFYKREGTLPGMEIGKAGDIPAELRAIQDIVPDFESKLLSEAVEPKFFEKAFAEGITDKVFSRGGLKTIFPETGPLAKFFPKNRTVLPYSAIERAGIPELGAFIAKKTPRQIADMGNVLKKLFRPARLAPQELHELFMTEMQLLPAYKLKQYYRKEAALREKFGLPENQIPENEFIMSFGIGYEKHLNELIEKLKYNPEAMEELHNIAREFGEEVRPIIDNIDIEMKRLKPGESMDYFKDAQAEIKSRKLPTQKKLPSEKTPGSHPDDSYLYVMDDEGGIHFIKYDAGSDHFNLIDDLDPNARKNAEWDINVYSYGDVAKHNKVPIERVVDGGFLTADGIIEPDIRSWAKKYGDNARQKIYDKWKKIYAERAKEADPKYLINLEKEIQKAKAKKPVSSIASRPEYKLSRNIIGTEIDDWMAEFDIKGRKLIGTNVEDRFGKGINYYSYLEKDIDRIFKKYNIKETPKDFFDVERTFGLGTPEKKAIDELLSYNKVIDDFVGDLIEKKRLYEKGLKDKLYEKSLKEVESKAIASSGNILRNDTLEKTSKKWTPYTEGVIDSITTGKPFGKFKLRDRTLSQLSNEQWPEIFRYRDNMTPEEALKVKKLRGYVRDWIKLPENEKLYTYAMKDELKTLLGYERIKGLKVDEFQGLHGGYLYGTKPQNAPKGEFKISSELEEALKIAEIPGFTKHKKFQSPIQHIIDHPKDIGGVETSLTNIVRARYEKSLQSVSVIDYLKKSRKFGVTDDLLAQAKKDYNTVKSKLINEGTVIKERQMYGVADDIKRLNNEIIQAKKNKPLASAYHSKTTYFTEEEIFNNKKVIEQWFKEFKEEPGRKFFIMEDDELISYYSYIEKDAKNILRKNGIDATPEEFIKLSKTTSFPDGSIERKVIDELYGYGKGMDDPVGTLIIKRDTELIRESLLKDRPLVERIQKLDPSTASKIAMEANIDKYGFDFSRMSKKLTTKETTQAGKLVEDIHGVLADVNFTPEIADYLTAASQFFADKNINSVVKLMQNFNKWWKTFATVVVPGFHMRNAQSNLFNMFLADGPSVLNPYLHNHVIKAMQGVDDSFYHPVLKRNVRYSELTDLYDKKVGDLGLFGDELNRAERKAISQTGKKPILEKIYEEIPTRVNSALPRYGAKLGQAVEHEAKLALFMDNWLKYGDADFAASRVHEYLFNYRDITVFDNNFMKVIMPFWTWSKKNIPLQWRNLIRQPRKFGTFVHLKDYMRNISEDPKTGKIPGYEFEPDYIKELMGVVTPFMTPSKTRMVYNPNFAFQDIGKVSAKDWLSSLTPMLKVPAELIANKEFYTEAPIVSKGSSGLKEAPLYMKWLKSALPFLPGLHDGVGYEGEPITMINPYLDYGIKQMPLFSNIGKAMPQSERLKEKTPLKLLSMLAGLKFFEYNPKTAEYWHLKDKIEELESIKDYYRKTGLWTD